MVSFKLNVSNYEDAERMAAAYLAAYFDNTEIIYPLSPFKMLKDEGIDFVIRNFNKLEGVYIPAQSQDDIAIVGINAKRPITRQRFTAAHELCHHFRDADKIACPIGQKNASEYFADAFASALLMPMFELRVKVNEYKDINGNVSFDDILKIADYFGVSFESCVRRIAYKIHAVEGDIENKELTKRIKKYQPDKKRKALGMSYENLYSDLIDNYVEQLRFAPNNYAKYVFENTYIYNDSRMEGLAVSIEEASEIVTDLRNNLQNSQYCTEENEAYLSIKDNPDDYEIITPSISILAQPSVAVVDEVVDDRGTREVATEYLQYLYSDEAQRIAGDHYYRPTNPTILQEYADVFDLNIDLVTIQDFGGWDEAQKKHFAEGGIFDEIYEK